MNINDLPWLLKMAHKICDEEWKKLGPDKRKRICENVLKRVDARIKAKESGKRGRSP